MARVLLTGMSGAGKSTLLAAVARRGYTTIDTDYDGWELPGALWDEPRMSALLAAHSTIAVSGTAQNQGRFYDRFEHVIYLRVPLETLRTATLELDGLLTISVLADRVENCLRS
jgi:RNase adaptor protein for sRNA GlmZ degradation